MKCVTPTKIVVALTVLLAICLSTCAFAGPIDRKVRPSDAEHMVTAMQRMDHSQKIAVARSILGIDKPPADTVLKPTTRVVNCYWHCWRNGACRWDAACQQNHCCNDY